jgi:peroxiredoxin/outer membrane lipoprotein-sorting protein
MRGVVLPCSLILCLASAAVAGDGALIERVAQRYETLKDYYMRGTFSFVARVGEMSQQFQAPFTQAGSAPGRMRMEIEDDVLGSVVVSDGESTWTYFKALDQYRRQATVPREGARAGGEAKPVPAVGGSFLDLYRQLAARGAASREIGTEDILLDGRMIGCTVIELAPTGPDSTGTVMGPDTLWVDPESALVLESIHCTTGEYQGAKTATRMVLSFDEIRVDEPPPGELFAFEPPAGAKEVEDFNVCSSSQRDLSGEPAPDFRLTGLDGKTHRLDSYRGKVVLLDFWASWCAPCRKELPTIEKLHREYWRRGLVVLAVNAETEKVARSFMKEYGYTFTVLSDPDGSVFDDYGVSAIPVTVVVDTEGQISAYFVGFDGEEELLAAIRKAGVH